MTRPVDWLYGLQHFGIKLGIDNIRALAEHLGRPDRAYRIVHVAGTNGKGSVAAMVEAVARRAGLRTGLFTSPHLVRPTERIRIDGEDLSEAELDRRLTEMRGHIDRALATGVLDAHPTFFETMTATALEAFRDRGVELAVLEVGLGGRLDATNVVVPDVSVIVSVDWDHMRSLGSTLEAIAFEKAGVVKPGRPVVSGVTQPGPRRVVRAIAAERAAPYVEARAELEVVPGSADPEAPFDLVRRIERDGRPGRYLGLRPSLTGEHQRENARIAVATLERLGTATGRPFTPDEVREGLAATRWPGRMQWIEGRPRILIDAAHNPSGVAYLARHLERIGVRGAVLVYGSTREKDLSRVLAPLGPSIDAVVATRSRIDRAMAATAIARYATPRFREVVVEPDPAAALDRARALAGEHGVVVVAGSIYMIGEVLAALEGDALSRPPVAM